MPKSWFFTPAGACASGSWGRRPHSPGPSGTTAAGSFYKEEIVISSSDEEHQAQLQQSHLLSEAATTNEEFLRQIELLKERSLRERGQAPASPPRAIVKEESYSLPRYASSRRRRRLSTA